MRTNVILMVLLLLFTLTACYSNTEGLDPSGFRYEVSIYGAYGGCKVWTNSYTVTPLGGLVIDGKSIVSIGGGIGAISYKVEASPGTWYLLEQGKRK